MHYKLFDLKGNVVVAGFANWSQLRRLRRLVGLYLELLP